MKRKCFCIILLLFITFITRAFSGQDQLPGLEIYPPGFDRLIPDRAFLFLTSLSDDTSADDASTDDASDDVSDDDDDDDAVDSKSSSSTDDASSENNKNDEILARIIFSYTIPIAYFTLSIINKEILYHDAPEDNYLRYINAPITSILVFGAGGFFTGLTLGLLLSEKDNAIDLFLYPVIVATLLGITGLIGGGIYALFDYDNIIANDLFYYSGPVLLLLIPVSDLFTMFAED